MKNIHILLVEDNDGDILLTTEALEDRKIVNNIEVIKDGGEAIDYLFKKGKYENALTPDIILLDINLPKKSGHEVLQVIKSEDKTKHIPVIMLTTSSSDKDINLSYKHHANCFITKPVEAEDFLEAMTGIEQFWVSLVSLPGHN